MKPFPLRCFALLLVLALLLPCLPLPSVRAAAAETFVLPVFETSDLHGFLVDSGYDDPADYQYRLAYIADKVDDARRGDCQNTLLLDGGDIYQGNVVSNLQNGAPIVAAYDAMEYDAVALGNHEFDWGIRSTTDSDGTMPKYTFNGNAYDSSIPVVCSNLYYRGTANRVEFTQDYVILPKTAISSTGEELEVNVAVIGYVENYASSIMSTEFSDYEIWDSVKAAEALARKLKTQGLADAVVLLAHADALVLASQFYGGTPIDLVCGGHSHYGQVGSTGATDYIQAASQGTAYAYTELCFTREGAVTVENSRHIWTTDSKSKLLDKPENAAELAPDVMEISHLALQGVEEEINTTLGYINTAITSYAISGNSMSTTGGNWMTDMANRATGSAVSFTNQGGIRASFYISGTQRYITKGDIYTIAPFDNLLYVYDVTYAQLLDILNFAVGQGRNLGLRMSGIDCYYQSGSVSALVLDGECIYKNGKWQEGRAQQTLRISANEFVATSSGTPFSSLNQSNALVSASHVDNKSFIRVLEEEGRQNDGFLFVDRQPHLIEKAYTGALDQDYTITTSCIGEGSVTPGTTLPAGSDFTVEILPAEGHEITEILIDGAKIAPTATYTFRNIQKDHSLCVTFSPIAQEEEPLPPCDGGEACPGRGFTDMPPAEHWSHPGIDFALSHGLFNGMSESLFAPEAAMTRGMLVTVLWRYAGSPRGADNPFADVPEEEWYTEAVAWAAAEGVVNGVREDLFEPESQVTREQMATILYRYAQNTGAARQEALTAFADAHRISDWAQEAVQWAVAGGLLQGTAEADGLLYLDPQGNATRAQVATILMRFIQARTTEAP